MSKRKLTALNNLYLHPPTNEHIERDFHQSFHDAWLAVSDLYDHLKVCHKDGVLKGLSVPAELALKELAQVRDSLEPEWGCWDLYLDLPADAPKPAEEAVAVAVGV
jgi:hypothetical protein